MELAILTALQFVAVHLLFGGPKTPVELRRGLGQVGMGQSLGAFSRLVRRLEWDGCVVVEYEKAGGGKRLRDCRIAATDMGVMRWQATREFYGRWLAPPAEFAPVPTEEGALGHLPARVRKAILKGRARQEAREVMAAVRRMVGM